jgi:hypothetical protein
MAMVRGEPQPPPRREQYTTRALNRGDFGLITEVVMGISGAEKKGGAWRPSLETCNQPASEKDLGGQLNFAR